MQWLELRITFKSEQIHDSNLYLYSRSMIQINSEGLGILYCFDHSFTILEKKNCAQMADNFYGK